MMYERAKAAESLLAARVEARVAAGKEAHHAEVKLQSTIHKPHTTNPIPSTTNQMQDREEALREKLKAAEETPNPKPRPRISDLRP